MSQGGKAREGKAGRGESQKGQAREVKAAPRESQRECLDTHRGVKGEKGDDEGDGFRSQGTAESSKDQGDL
jgi:hypothetical protein